MRRINPLILTTVSIAAVIASPAAAQQTQSDKAPPQTLTTEQEIKSGKAAAPTTDPAAKTSPSNSEQITVTGTRIRRPNLESPLPVTSIGGDEFFQTGNVSVGDKLAELPSIRSTFTQANSTRFLGTSGLSLLDLRGLGTVRTLVLVNGRRHVGGDVLNSGVTVDTNTIPTDLIDRVDVVTGGNSAVYGSDAIAGVVNFILKDHYNGFQVRGQGGLSKYGDAGSYFISGLAGKNFAGGRGNIALNVEYARQEQAFASERSFLARQDAFVVVDTDPPACAAGQPLTAGCSLNGSDGNPDRLFFRNINSASFGNTGVLLFGSTDRRGTITQRYNCGTDPLGRFYNCPFQFTPSGDLVPITGQRIGLGPNGSFIGGNGENFRSGDQFQILPKLERFNVNLVGHLEISPAFVPFMEAKFSRTTSTGSGGSGPAFISGTTLSDLFGFTDSPTGRNRERIRLDNPYLSTQARDTICAQRTLGGQTCTNMTTFALRENLTGLGNRTEIARRDTYRIVGGIKGDFADDFHYELSGNYGRLEEKTQVLGNLDIQHFLLANDPVRNASGQIVCRSQIDPTAAFGSGPYYYYLYGYPSPPADPNAKARLANDVAQCVPINPFGGQFTDAQRAYLLRNTTSKGRTSQLDVTGFISGNTNKFFNLWGGPVGFVVGAEYREENLFYQQDSDVALGYTFYNGIPTFKAPKQRVKEAFGEISIPIIKDRRFLNEFEIDGAARVSHYSIGSTGTVYAYNISGIYSPVQGVRFRANYARAVRAPNQSELFSPAGQNYATVVDPCSARNLGTGSQFRAANCTAAGAPAGYDFVYNQSLGYNSGGNAALKAEKSDSYTAGVVLTPRLIPGLSISSDYYNIRLNQAIAFVGPQSVLNACYDLPTYPNSFCSQFRRFAGPGTGRGNEIPFQVLENSLIAQPLNYAKQTAKGIDTEVAYRHQFGRIGRLDTRFTYTHVINRNNFISATDPNFQSVQLLTLGDPQDAFNWNTSVTHGRFTVGYQMRYISKMVLNAYADTFSVQGRPPQNADYANVRFYPRRFYHDVRLGIDVGPKYNFYLGADNVTNTKPPYGLSGSGGGSAIYDNRGRYYYAGAVAKF